MKVTLGSVASYINGFAFKPTDWSTCGLKIIRIQNLTNPTSEANYYSGTYDLKYEVNRGDVLISWSASLGIYIWQDEKAVLNQHIFKVVFDKVSLNKKYFFYQVSYILKRAESETHGATMKHLTRPVFNALPFELPSMEQQNFIANELDIIARLINAHKRQLHLLDELVKSRFVEMFGDLKTNNKQWPVHLFTDFAKIDTHMIHDFQGYEEYPHIGIDSIEKESGKILKYNTVNEDKIISGKYLFTSSHVLYSKIRPNLNKVALPDFEGVCSADAYPILPKSGKCNRTFLAYTMRSRVFLDYILAFSNRTNLPKVNKSL